MLNPGNAIGRGESLQAIGAEELENDSGTSISVPAHLCKSSASNILPRFIHACCITWVKRSSRILLLVLLMAGCAQQTGQMRDGKMYGVTEGVFHGRWWNYYERGASFLDGEFYDEAEADFKEAVKMRSRDAWQARTYGLHFTEYFPLRELGVTYYHLDRLDEAQKNIEMSLGDVDTGRAHHYLDLIKRAKVANGQLRDDDSPRIETAMQDGMLLASRELRLPITATDDLAVECVRVNGRELHQRGSSASIGFEDELLLVEGTHEILVEASDLADRTASSVKKVVVDLTGPTLGIFEPADGLITNARYVTLKAAAVDRNGVASVTLDERTLAQGNGDKRVEFNTRLDLQDGENKFIIIAKDMAGNENRMAISVFKGAKTSAAARLWWIKDHAPELLEMAAINPSSMISVMSMSLESLKAATEGPVVITLYSPKKDQPYRHNKTLRVKGIIVSQTKVASLSINGQPYEELVGAPKESFDRRIPISEEDIRKGEATIEIAVLGGDDLGNEKTEAFEVIIQPVSTDKRESKMPLAVMAFGGGADEKLREDLRAMSQAQLVNRERFNMVERQQLAAVMTEQQLSEALGNPDAALRLGKIIPAQVFLIGDVVERGNEIEVMVRAVSTETGSIVAQVDTNIPDKNDIEKMKFGCDDLAQQLLDAFPRLSGEVLSERSGQIMVNWTTEDGIREGMRMLIVEVQEPWIDEDTGEVLEEGDVITVGKAIITNVTSNYTKAKVEGGAQLEKGMPAITM